jgi:ABC-2 type transport system ATP-binding protein
LKPGRKTTLIIEIKSLTKKYSNGRGIFDLDLGVPRGDLFGFLGPNGAGKTTAMKIMTGMMRADSGEVRIMGHSVQTEFEQAMARVGCIVETAESYAYLSAEENLRQFARYYPGVGEARIDEVLALTGLSRYKKEKAGNFSLGMKQRLGIASAILSRPEVVILDEPLNGLDIEGMVEMRNLFKKMAAEDNTTFFISSHLVHDVELTCNRIGIIHEGRIAGVRSMDEILNRYDSLEQYFISEVGSLGNV